ncbi:unnamed protein product, partial [Rotaria magnacalcarata]
RRNLGLDEEIPPDHQKWQLTTASADSPEKSESRVATGDTGVSKKIQIEIVEFSAA